MLTKFGEERFSLKKILQLVEIFFHSDKMFWYKMGYSKTIDIMFIIAFGHR